jgi:hypothetical protein
MPTNYVKSTVKRLFVNVTGCYIKLENPEVAPKNYFALLKSHSNYNALYALAVAAAVNRYNLHIRTVNNIDPSSDEDAEISYFVVDW